MGEKCNMDSDKAGTHKPKRRKKNSTHGILLNERIQNFRLFESE